MIIENHNGIAYIVFSFRLPTCLSEDRTVPADMEYKKYWDMMTDHLNHSVRSRGIQDYFIFTKHLFP